MPIREGLRGLSRFILFQSVFTKSPRLRKSGRHALLYRKLSYVVCTVFTHYAAKKDRKYKYVTLFIKLYTLPTCLTMSITRATLLFINYFNGRYYISAYTVLIFTTLCAQAQNAVAFTGAIISSYHVGMI